MSELEVIATAVVNIFLTNYLIRHPQVGVFLYKLKCNTANVSISLQDQCIILLADLHVYSFYIVLKYALTIYGK